MATVLVTGASRGIGRAIAITLAERGAKIALHYQSDRTGAAETREAMHGDGHALIEGDLTDGAASSEIWHRALEELGSIDVLINNAGIYPDHPILETSYEDWRTIWHKTLSINLFGPANLSFLAARAMVKKGGGRIVNISSRGAFRGEPSAPAYGASKAALNAMSQSLAKALAPNGVYVYVLAPGWVNTDRVAHRVAQADVLVDQPLGRVASCTEVAQVAAFCALDAPPSLTGGILDVNGASYLRS